VAERQRGDQVAYVIEQLNRANAEVARLNPLLEAAEQTRRAFEDKLDEAILEQGRIRGELRERYGDDVTRLEHELEDWRKWYAKNLGRARGDREGMMGENKPHRCPRCDGRGKLPYNPDNPYGGAETSAGPWMCPSCFGQGILWWIAPDYLPSPSRR
jgi:hypothetical protein